MPRTMTRHRRSPTRLPWDLPAWDSVGWFVLTCDGTVTSPSTCHRQGFHPRRLTRVLLSHNQSLRARLLTEQFPLRLQTTITRGKYRASRHRASRGPPVVPRPGTVPIGATRALKRKENGRNSPMNLLSDGGECKKSSRALRMTVGQVVARAVHSPVVRLLTRLPSLGMPLRY